MIGFANSTSPALAAEPSFSAEEALDGVCATTPCDGPGRIWAEVDGRGDCLRFYGSDPGGAPAHPIVFLGGDIFRRAEGRRGIEWEVPCGYRLGSPLTMQIEAEQHAATIGRCFVNLARPGTYGSSGDHRQRRRPREVALVDRALDRLKRHFGWTGIDLAGLSGGGHLVAALMARRSDIRCAVIASGSVAVRQRLHERGLEVNVTGYADFVDLIDLVRDVARHPPGKVMALTDPLDRIVSPSSQAAYIDALRTAGVEVEQKLVPADDPSHHIIGLPAILACFPKP